MHHNSCTSDGVEGSVNSLSFLAGRKELFLLDLRVLRWLNLTSILNPCIRMMRLYQFSSHLYMKKLGSRHDFVVLIYNCHD